MSQQEVDEIEIETEPSGTFWVENPLTDILVCYSEETAASSGPMLVKAIQEGFPDTRIDFASFPSVKKESFSFSKETVEKQVARFNKKCYFLGFLLSKYANGCYHNKQRLVVP